MALASAALLFLISARASPEWAAGTRILPAAKEGIELHPTRRWLFVLIPFGVATGIPASMGLVPGNVLTPLGGLMACMLGRRLLSGRSPALPGWTSRIDKESGAIAGYIWTSPYGWFLILCWIAATPGLFIGSFSLVQGLALGVVMGPVALTGGLIQSTALALLTIPGLFAAAFWSSSLYRVKGSEATRAGKSGVDTLLRWGETALAASLVAAPVWGPSLGALVAVPVDEQTGRRVAVSFGITCAAIAVASFVRRITLQPQRGIWFVCAGLSLGALALAPVLR